MVWLLLLACAYRPPPEPPPLIAAQGHVRLVPGAPDRVQVAFRAGSAHDPPGREGLASAAARAVTVEAPQVSASIGREVVVYSAPADALGSIVQALSTPTAQAAVETVSPLTGDCALLASEAWDTWIYAGHPYGHPVGGRRSVLLSITAPEVDRFRARRYVRGATVASLPAGGDVATLDILAPALSSAVTPTTLPPVAGEGILVVEAPVDAGCTAVGHRVEGEPRLATALARAAWGAVEIEPTRRQNRFVLTSALDGIDAAAPARVAERFTALAYAGFDEESFERARSAVAAWDDSSEAIERAVLGLPVVLPLRDLVVSADRAATNRELAAIVDPSAARFVVVVPDASAFRDTEGMTLPGVQAIIRIEDLFR